jgi:hypothetical protein
LTDSRRAAPAALSREAPLALGVGQVVLVPEDLGGPLQLGHAAGGEVDEE